MADPKKIINMAELRVQIQEMSLELLNRDNLHAIAEDYRALLVDLIDLNMRLEDVISHFKIEIATARGIARTYRGGKKHIAIVALDRYAHALADAELSMQSSPASQIN